MKKKSIRSDLDILMDLPVRVDFILLKDSFLHYQNPKKKIFDLNKKGLLRQIKRAQYFNLKSKRFETTPYELVANSLYYPSYVSLEWALQYYGLISDTVKVVTSVTLLPSKDFKTPYAPFTYKHIIKSRYPVGYISKNISAGESFLIARPEKALLDYVSIQAKDLVIKTEYDIQEFLENDLRLDLKEFYKKINLSDMKELLPYYHRNSKEYRILKWIILGKDKKS